MRTGLIPNAHKNVDAAAVVTTHRAGGGIVAIPEGPRTLRKALRLEAEALDEIAEAARAGNVRRVLVIARRLADLNDHVRFHTFDTSAA